MNSEEILRFCLEKGLLVDKSVLNLFNESWDVESVKIILEKMKSHTQQRVITRNFFLENKDKLNEVFFGLSKENQQKLEGFKIRLGLNIEISAEKVVEKKVVDEKEFSEDVRVISRAPPQSKKLEVSDFVKYFRGRLSSMKTLLEEHSELDSLISINKISVQRQGISLIGIVSDKSVTKNKNIIFEIEDLTGKIKVLVNHDKKELYEKAEDVALDSVIGIKGSGNNEIIFVNDIIFPESVIQERKKGLADEYALFIGDLHFGSKRFLEKEFLKFIDYLNGQIGNDPEVEKIKYLFIVGDVVTGVGNYPDQEKDLRIKDLEEQFSQLAKLLGKIRKDIKIIISPGNHDGVRLMEPQPFLDEKFAWPLYNLKNVFLTANPCFLNIGAKQGFSGFNVLTYHGFSFPFYANNVSKLMKEKSMNSPEKIAKYLLMNRHLAPTHSSVQYFPDEKDPLFIQEVPDIFVSAHTHKSAVSYYNNVLIISTSCWEAMTPYQEKFGNEPDHCKVPMFNLKTRAIKILDFEESGTELKNEGLEVENE